MLSLTKGQPIALDNNGTPVTQFHAAIGWDMTASGKKGIGGALARRKGVDLDLAVVALDANKQPLACCGFDTPDVMGMHHTGDNKSGKGAGDDEVAIVDLTKLPGQVESLLVAATSFKGGGFDKVGSLYYRIVDSSGGQETDLTGEVFVPIVPQYNAVVLAKVSRQPSGGWKIETRGDMGTASYWRDLVDLHG